MIKLDIAPSRDTIRDLPNEGGSIEEVEEVNKERPLWRKLVKYTSKSFAERCDCSKLFDVSSI